MSLFLFPAILSLRETNGPHDSSQLCHICDIFKKNMDDKRQFRRFQLTLPSELRPETTDAAPIPVTVVDASFGGLGIISPESFPSDTLITLSWDRPPFAPNQKVSIKGRIVSSRRKPNQPGKFALNMAYQEPNPALTQQLLHWAQMQLHIQTKARTRAQGTGSTKPRNNSFF